jgi:hypothetical protein
MFSQCSRAFQQSQVAHVEYIEGAECDDVGQSKAPV